MNNRFIEIFICHAHEDQEVAIEIYNNLKLLGFKPWLDKIDLLPGQYWRDEIPKVIHRADFVLILFSKISVSKRGYIQKEFKYALDILEEIPFGKIYIIPVKIDNCIVPYRFKDLHYCSYFEKDGFKKILNSIFSQIKKSNKGLSIKLRNTCIEELSDYEVRKMLKEKNFFDRKKWLGDGIPHLYEKQQQNDQIVIIDHTTNLMWQMNTSGLINDYNEALEYISHLNKSYFFKQSDWRLPTLEEAMSIVEPTKNEYIFHPLFHSFDNCSNLWTCDFNYGMNTRAWKVDLDHCYCYNDSVHANETGVRAVRNI